MAKAFKPQVVTANDLIEGDSVFLARSGWVRDIAEARVARTAEEADLLLEAGVVAEAENTVVGPYLVEVGLETGAPVPLLRRERIRAEGGPTFAYAPEGIARAA
ncbi:DUF2849 domain-containing protein [Paralimibaculum aggregatum]|uniref:DUF2849 domain-containing protein n=1 Tax=Paralimibaculum aggregatum TaxID=3036245 RepID=A0ABQ6LMA8_9RHOB|nr:DUF2849 domain-containing protein [Limibaculum sp. NKW23]GMG82822.1 DUF2849 domain-containing protein [Limibaculum sp. NKW23]